MCKGELTEIIEPEAVCHRRNITSSDEGGYKGWMECDGACGYASLIVWITDSQKANIDCGRKSQSHCKIIEVHAVHRDNVRDVIALRTSSVDVFDVKPGRNFFKRARARGRNCRDREDAARRNARGIDLQ